MGSYASAWDFLARDLRNDGMRGWAATITMITTILWLFCAGMTVYLGFWKGSMFSAPGLEDWTGDKDDQDEKSRGGRRDEWNGTYSLPSEEGSNDEEKAQANGSDHGDENGNGNDVRRRS